MVSPVTAPAPKGAQDELSTRVTAKLIAVRGRRKEAVNRPERPGMDKGDPAIKMPEKRHQMGDRAPGHRRGAGPNLPGLRAPKRPDHRKAA